MPIPESVKHMDGYRIEAIIYRVKTGDDSFLDVPMEAGTRLSEKKDAQEGYVLLDADFTTFHLYKEDIGAIVPKREDRVLRITDGSEWLVEEANRKLLGLYFILDCRQAR